MVTMNKYFNILIFLLIFSSSNSFAQSGEPVQNAFVEQNNCSLQKELFDAYLFFSLPEVRKMAQEWQHDHNYQRPHRSLGLFHRLNLINPFP
jgi:transposase InsO family protein